MSWLIRALSSTIGQKLVIGATGLLLCGFLVVHLAGNLLMYRGPEVYNRYAHELHEAEWLPFAEAGLLVLFVLHICLALWITRRNTAARTSRYEEKESKIEPGILWPLRPSSTMHWTGIVVFVFLVLHVIDFRLADLHLRFPVLEGVDEDDFSYALRVLRDPLSATVYVIGSLFLGWHVAHGFQSAFRSLGFAHPKYTPLLEKLSLIFAFVVAIGFASFPIWVNFVAAEPIPATAGVMGDGR